MLSLGAILPEKADHPLHLIGDTLAGLFHDPDTMMVRQELPADLIKLGLGRTASKSAKLADKVRVRGVEKFPHERVVARKRGYALLPHLGDHRCCGIDAFTVLQLNHGTLHESVTAIFRIYI
jgi:hypothetical protein